MSAEQDLVGRQIAHYRVLEKLGAGGMGEVYLAEDTQLGRKIALKVLHAGTASDPERLARFRQEAKALASINHPGIVTVYSVEEIDGLDFITMELVEGTTLSSAMGGSRLSLDRFFDIALALTDALSMAHEKGVAHRDLKPGNIMVASNWSIKILDFGLAKLLQEAPGGQDETEILTREFQVMGTAGYMSPEQLRGETIDYRSDIFSLGVVLYEMATGRRPFEGKSSLDLATSILRETPAPLTDLAPELPRHLGRIINLCLGKDPDSRFQTARDVHNQLRELKNEIKTEEILTSRIGIRQLDAGRPRPWLKKAAIAAGAVGLLALGFALYRGIGGPGRVPSEAAAPLAETPRIVVLPFENLGPPEDAFFADGMTEEITSRLAMIQGLSVISRTTAVRIAKTQSIQEIGEELGVDYVLEGTVRWSRDADGPSRVRVTPQLIRVSDDSHLWATTYDEVIEDVFDVQSAVAAAVIESLGVSLLGSDRESLEARPTESVSAYQALLRAREWTRQPFSEETQRMTVQMLERAVELDPGFGLAWAGLAQHHALLYFNNWDATSGRLALAKAALDNAERLLPDDPRARLAAGYYRYYGLGDYQGAIEEFEEAARGLPNDSEVMQAIGFAQRRLGRLEDALDRLSAARGLDPQNVDLIDQIAETAQALRRYGPADEQWRQAIALAPDRTVLYERRAENELRWRGDVASARAILESAPEPDASLFSWDRIGFLDLDLLEREYDAVLAELGGSPQDDPVKEAKRLLTLGLTARLAGRGEQAETALEASRGIFENLVFRSPESQRFKSGLGLALALLGRREAAIEAGTEAVEGSATDLFTGPRRRENLAAIYAWSNEPDRAIELLTDLLSQHYQASISPALLAIDPTWEPLRQDSRFQGLAGAG